MSEVDDFLSDVLPRQIEAEIAIHNGDIEPRFEIWSHNDPVTLFGAMGPNNSGWEDVSRIFRWVASRFSGNVSYEFDLIAAGASGDIAYTVGFERNAQSTDGGPVRPNELRVTHVDRREDGEWKIVHRHADYPPADQSKAITEG